MSAASDEPRPLLQLQAIPAVSPSLAEMLRACPLQAAFSRMQELRRLVLGNPKAWLGTAYHEVLEKIVAARTENVTGAESIDLLWLAAISKIRERALSHPLDRRFDVPERWPGYHLALACVRLRAHELISENPQGAAQFHGATANLREQYLTALGGKLVGKPDVVGADEIRDYKSGTVYEEMPDGSQIVKEGYVRQLRLYGHLVFEKLGRCPAKGKLLPMRGDVVEIDLEPAACANEAAAAIERLDSFNARLLGVSSNVSDLANPSTGNCRWCHFKAVCPAFWEHANTSWQEELFSGAVKGSLIEGPSLIHNGRARALSLSVIAGTEAVSDITIVPLDVNVHAEISNLKAGDEIRVINLYRRRDGVLAPTAATVCLDTVSLPTFGGPAPVQ